MKSTANQSTQAKTISRNRLSELQIEVLEILYKFRFANASLISRYQKQTSRNSNFRLKNLLEQGYIDRFYDDSYIINRWQATYYLVSDGINYLKQNADLDAKGLHLLYYNRQAKPAFINHWIRLFRVYLKFYELYGDKLDFYSSTELAEETKFPKDRPDAFLSFSGKYSQMPNCMLDLLESSKPINYLRQRATRYIYHYETTSDWGSDYPRILLVCDNAGLEREIQQTVARTLDRTGNIKPEYYTTTLRPLLGGLKNIWTDVQEPEKLKSI